MIDERQFDPAHQLGRVRALEILVGIAIGDLPSAQGASRYELIAVLRDLLDAQRDLLARDLPDARFETFVEGLGETVAHVLDHLEKRP